jgi:hypothetical protein
MYTAVRVHGRTTPVAYVRAIVPAAVPRRRLARGTSAARVRPLSRKPRPLARRAVVRRGAPAAERGASDSRGSGWRERSAIPPARYRGPQHVDSRFPRRPRASGRGGHTRVGGIFSGEAPSRLFRAVSRQGDCCSRRPCLKDSSMLCTDNGRTLNALISILYFPQIVGACFVGRPLYLSGPAPFTRSRTDLVD